MSAARTSSSSSACSSHTAYTTFVSVIPGLVEQVNSTGTVFTTHDQTMTITVTDPASYDAMVGYESIPITSSGDRAGGSSAASPEQTDVARAGGGLAVASLAGVAIGCVVAASLLTLLAAWLVGRPRLRRCVKRTASVGGQMSMRPSRERTGNVNGNEKENARAHKAELDGEEVRGDKEQQVETGWVGLSSEGSRHKLQSGGLSGMRSVEGVAELAG